MSWHVYVLENAEGRRYVGYTGRGPEQRLQEHNDGLNQWTRAHRPWRLVYSESHQAKADALHRERYLKTGAAADLKTRRAGGARPAGDTISATESAAAERLRS